MSYHMDEDELRREQLDQYRSDVFLDEDKPEVALMDEERDFLANEELVMRAMGCNNAELTMEEDDAVTIDGVKQMLNRRGGFEDKE